jgi:hypothetical protein
MHFQKNIGQLPMEPPQNDVVINQLHETPVGTGRLSKLLPINMAANTSVFSNEQAAVNKQKLR